MYSKVVVKKMPSELRVLVVDDDSMLVLFMEALLHSLGIGNVATAGEGAEAISKMDLAKDGFDLIICDLVMPTMDGFDFLWQLASRQSKIPLIIVSAQAEEVRHSAALVAKLKSLILIGDVAKPVQQEEFRQLVKSLLITS